MARINIELPDSFLFSTTLQVRATDLNYGGHVGNDTILGFMQEIRVQFYRSLGYNSELHFEGSIGQIMTDAAVVYKSEGFLGNLIEGKIGVADFNKYGFDFVYLLTNTSTGKELARGKTGVVCFDYESRKVVSVPQSLLARINPL